MDCRAFRENHVMFVDDVLPSAEMAAMEQHLSTCMRCSRHDTSIRRSLLLVRNLPPIEPSPEFMARLNARLEQVNASPRVDIVAPRPYLPSFGAYAALAAGVLAVAYMAVETTRYYAPVSGHMAPVTASASDFSPMPMANGAFVASVPTGMPVWPAVLMVGESPMHFANLEFRDEASTR
jgi:anti-sigma factor RsiW